MAATWLVGGVSASPATHVLVSNWLVMNGEALGFARFSMMIVVIADIYREVRSVSTTGGFEPGIPSRTAGQPWIPLPGADLTADNNAPYPADPSNCVAGS